VRPPATASAASIRPHTGVDDGLDTHEGDDQWRRTAVLDLGGLGGGEEVDHGAEGGDHGDRRAERQQPAEAVADHGVAPKRQESRGHAGKAQQSDEVGGIPRRLDEHRVELLGLVALVASRGVQRELFVGLGVADALMYFGRQAGLHIPPLHAGAWLAWVSIWLVPLAMAAAGIAIMVFPTGRHLSPRWRAASYVMAGLAALVAVGSALWPIEDDWRHSGLVFPFELGGEDIARAAILWPMMLSCYTGLQVLWAAAAVTRPRRGRQSRGPPAAVVRLRGGGLGGAPARRAGHLGHALLGLLTLPLLPLAAGMAIVRHRLYDIDPVINKALVGGAMLLPPWATSAWSSGSAPASGARRGAGPHRDRRGGGRVRARTTSRAGAGGPARLWPACDPLRDALAPLRAAGPHRRTHKASGPPSSSRLKAASSSVGTPSCSALSAFDPAFSPTTT
jgi:hypothetical protein